MADKNKQTAQPGASLQQQLAAPVQSGNPAGRPDVSALELEIEKLRRENAILRMQQPNPGVAMLDGTRGVLMLYRVALEGVKPKRTSRVISPRLTAPDHFKLVPIGSYEDLDLFCHEAQADTNKIADAAWQRFVAEGHEIVETTTNGTTNYKLEDKHRRFFFVDPQNGPMVDHLDIPAYSPADAFELFRTLNGIIATSMRPVVECLGPVEQKALSPAVDKVAAA